MVETSILPTSAQVFAGQLYFHNEVAFEIALARSEEDLLASFRILYDAYLRAGLVGENPLGMRVTPYHLLPTTDVFVAKSNNTVNSTMTMTLDATAGLPMDSMYKEEVDWLRAKGLKLAEIGSLADRRKSPVRFMRVFHELSKLICQVARARGMDGLVVATHPRHAGFYARTFGFREFGMLKACPYAKDNPAVALHLDFDAIRGTPYDDHLFGVPFKPEMLKKHAWGSETIQKVQSIYSAISGQTSKQLPTT